MRLYLFAIPQIFSFFGKIRTEIIRSQAIDLIDLVFIHVLRWYRCSFEEKMLMFARI